MSGEWVGGHPCGNAEQGGGLSGGLHRLQVRGTIWRKQRGYDDHDIEKITTTMAMII